VIRTWKLPHILKGVSTWIPPLNAWRLQRSTTGGSDSSRYCYSVWLRHLVLLQEYGFRVQGTRVGELGPGDSIGIGLAALLSGAFQYVGLDVMPFAARADLEPIFDDLVRMYGQKEPIPDHEEFPTVRPTTDLYEFPDHLIDWTEFDGRADRIRRNLQLGMNQGAYISYKAPWTSSHDIAEASLDLMFSQAVLEHVDPLEETYRAMYAWLKPGGYASHVIDFGAHDRSPVWNGHWVYSDWEWQLVRGRREWLLNREPLSTHVALAKKVGFTVLLERREYNNEGYALQDLARRFQGLNREDIRTRGTVLVLRKS
jgi:SAM-dependent methyltransferase